jgi:hypothetical protein
MRRGLAVLESSVPDTGRFATDPDPRIRTAGLQTRKLLSSSVALKMPAKNIFVFTSFLLIIYLR